MPTVEPKKETVKAKPTVYNPLVSLVCGAFGKNPEDMAAASIIGSIASGAWRKEVEAIRQTYGGTLKKTGRVKDAKEAVRKDKNALFAALWSGTFSSRGDDKLKVYSGLLCADLDDLPDEDLPALRGTLANDPHVCACFTSPTGAGLKVLFRVAGTAEQHHGNFLSVRKYVKDTYGLEIDEACKNVERLCFVSYDKRTRWNPDAEPLQPLAESVKAKAAPGRAQPQPAPDTGEPDLDARAEIAEDVLGAIEWGSDTLGYCVCPGIKLHTSGDAQKDCRVTIDGAPTISCFHSSCKEAVAKANLKLRSRVARAERDRDYIILPSGNVSLSDCARDIFERDTGFYYRGGAVCELVREADATRLDVVRPDAFRSRVERLGKLVAWRSGQRGDTVLKLGRMSVDDAKGILATMEARELLPAVANVVRCAVITERQGKLVILGKGYHAELGGLVILAGEDPPELPLKDAVDALLWTVEELAFQTPADKSRALAARITPALKMGGLLPGSTPLDVMESDQPQAGKGYSHSITTAIYQEAAYLVQQRNGGVGSTDESFAAALVAGRPFIGLDNVRGRLDSAYIESFLTVPEGTLFGARIPGCREMLIDPRRYALQLTSNGMESTPDLARRSSISRILKQPGKAFQDTPKRIRADQTLLLGAVFATVREWHRQGKPRTNELRHDFRSWCQPLDWIVQNLLGQAPLMDGHEAALLRVSTPALIWLRSVAIALEASGRMGAALTASGLAEVCQSQLIEIPGSHGRVDLDIGKRIIGGLMRRVFGAGEQVTIEGFLVKRTVKEYRKPSGDWDTAPAYLFQVA